MKSIYELESAINYSKQNILKLVIDANRELGQLNGIAKSIPNEQILFNTLVLQESKESSEIEQIVTTYDDLFKHINRETDNKNLKEVLNYRAAILASMQKVKENKFLTLNYIKVIHSILDPETGDFRKTPGTVLRDQDNNIVYTPPSVPEIDGLMNELELYINSDSEMDALIKLALIHFQFESIHPFYDGNGRTGRVINILFLLMNELLDFPILYLSRYINQNKIEYYNLIRNIQTNNEVNEWVAFVLKGIIIMCQETSAKIITINNLVKETKDNIRNNASEIYSKDLLEIIFKHVYSTVKDIEEELGVHRHTAAKYLNTLVDIGVMEKTRSGNTNIYINKKLFDLFKD